jgi:hypothetical protein
MEYKLQKRHQLSRASFRCMHTAQSTPVPPLSHINYQCTAGFENAGNFFLWGNYFMGHFKGNFERAKTFLTPKLSRAQNLIRGNSLVFLLVCGANMRGCVSRRLAS